MTSHEIYPPHVCGTRPQRPHRPVRVHDPAKRTMTDHSALDREAVIDLMDGKPTTLHAGLQRYLIEVAGRDELQPRDRIIAELGMLLAYPWPGDHPDLRDEVQAYASSVAAYAATFSDFDEVGRVLAEVADLLIGMLRRTSATAPVPGNCEG